MFVQSNIFASRVFWKLLWWVIKFSLAALIIALPIRFFIAQPFLVSGLSMEPTLMPDEYLVIDKLWYKFHQPERGDVIIMRYPFDPSVYIVKRIIGTPGESVSMTKGVVTVQKNDGSFLILHEPYLHDDFQKSDNTATSTLAKNEFFVLGDNRLHSSDSREWGPLQSRFVVGRAFARLSPLDKIEVLPGHFRYEAHEI